MGLDEETIIKHKDMKKRLFILGLIGAVLLAPLGVVYIAYWISRHNLNRNKVFTAREIKQLDDYTAALGACGIVCIFYGMLLYLL